MTAWDISTAVYLQNFSVAGEETQPSGVFFKPDGSKMYVVGYNQNRVNEYDLSTPWSVVTASYLQNFSVASEDGVNMGVFFKPDGTKMYTIGITAGNVNEYNLSTPWSVVTASLNQVKSVAAQDASPTDLFFKSDGTKMYTVGAANLNVYHYWITTPWDISTLSYAQTKSVAAQDSEPQGLFFKPDGSKMYVVGYNGRDINEYDLPDPWDLSTSVYLQNFSVAGEETLPMGMFFKPDGSKMYVVGHQGIDVNEYNLPVVGTNIKINIGDNLKDVASIQINIGDVLKDVINVQQNIGDVWKTVF